MSYCRYTTDEGCFQNWARRLVAKKMGGVPGGEQCECCDCGRVATGSISSSCVFSAGRRPVVGRFIGKVFGAKKQRSVFCFSVCLCLLFCLFSWVFLRDPSWKPRWLAGKSPVLIGDTPQKSNTESKNMAIFVKESHLWKKPSLLGIHLNFFREFRSVRGFPVGWKSPIVEALTSNLAESRRVYSNWLSHPKHLVSWALRDGWEGRKRRQVDGVDGWKLSLVKVICKSPFFFSMAL